MTGIRRLSIIGVVVTTALASGCGGGGAKVQSEITTTTKGQQLLDLKKAYDSGEGLAPWS